jgi:ArsR family transcriptional regulator, zinc-responsive transcriptional repressor
MPESPPCAPTGTQMPTTDRTAKTVALFAAMAHPIRVRVLLALSRLGPLAVGGIQDCLDVEQSALSHQLRVLRDGQLVLGERDGRKVIYRLADHHVGHIVEDAFTHANEGS